MIWDLNPTDPNCLNSIDIWGTTWNKITKGRRANQRQNTGFICGSQNLFISLQLRCYTSSWITEPSNNHLQKGKEKLLHICVYLFGKSRNEIQEPCNSLPWQHSHPNLMPALRVNTQGGKAAQIKQYWPYVTFSKTPKLSPFFN